MRLSICFAVVAALFVPAVAHAQSEEPRVIVVPYPGEAHADAGTPAATVAPEPPPPPANNYPPPPPANNPPPPVNNPPPPEPPKTIDAMPDNGEVPPPPPPDNLQPKEVPASPPSAMLDGHPREGAFLSGPGSFVFILHHTLMSMTLGLSTQLMYRLLSPDPAVHGCDSSVEVSSCAQGARLAYLASGLLGAGIGFATSAAWQFYNWMSENTAYYGLIMSIVGGFFGGGVMNLATKDAQATSWGAWVGALAGAWLLAIIGGGELATNKGLLLVTGAYWALAFAGVVVAIFATTSGASDSDSLRKGVDTLAIFPALGAGAMALALLKFNPSSAQILRADLFGTAAGAAVLVISALVLGGNFAHSPVPYILGGVAAAGAITTVSLLWAEAAEAPPPVTPGTPPGAQPAKPAYKGVW